MRAQDIKQGWDLMYFCYSPYQLKAEWPMVRDNGHISLKYLEGTIFETVAVKKSNALAVFSHIQYVLLYACLLESRHCHHPLRYLTALDL